MDSIDDALFVRPVGPKPTYLSDTISLRALPSRSFQASQPVFSMAAIESIVGAAAVGAAALAAVVFETFALPAFELFADALLAPEPQAEDITATAVTSKSDLK